MSGDAMPGGSGSAPEGLGFVSSVPGSSIPGNSAPPRISRRQRREMREQAGSTGVGSPLVAGSVAASNPVHEVPAPHEPQAPHEPHLTPAFPTKAESEPDWDTLMGEKPNKATSPVAANSPHRKRKTSVSVLVMSGVGQTMLTAGVVLALFVVWQLYVTTWQVQGARAAAVESFTKSGVQEAAQTTEEQRFDPPPPVTIPPFGQTFGTLHVPRWDAMVIPIMEGTTSAVLDTGYAGHYQETQGPGEIGNFALAAHRRSYGNSFRRVEELQIGDPLVVETAQAWLVYQVSSTEVVLPTQGEVIHPVPHKPKDTVPTERLMTLTTCHPEYGSTERFIVYSKLSYWVPRSAGRPVALQGIAAMQSVGGAGGATGDASAGTPAGTPAQ
ncbi:class E sortase [Mobiluncus mulieris]|uniref:class E sortase n=1 Tax=Mobiluncus mulieris TaxID=2052 RepID=UPI0014708595|nr:class E sortase [Mobiluncus mulieris]NMW59944.1 class E sortase [Mobiluncus mulieris]